MSADDRAGAAAMLAEDGQTVTLTRRTSGAYNPATGTADVTETTQQASAVILPFSQGIRTQAGTSVLATDRWCILAALAVAGTVLTPPVVNDTLTDAAGDKWTITEVSPLTPAGLDIIYELTIRGAGA